MHRSCRVDVTKLLRDGVNTLALEFTPFDWETKDAPLLNFQIEDWSDAIGDRLLCKKRGASRAKADYTLGWDWAQGLPSCGIWRDCYLEVNDFARIREPRLSTKRDGTVKCTFTLESVLKDVLDGMLTMAIWHDGVQVTSQTTPQVIAPYCWDYEQTLSVPSPQLWYPRGYGDQALYELEITVTAGEYSVTQRIPFAFREVRLERKELTAEQELFRFCINGVAVFAKGANWIPADIIPGRVTKAHLAHLLDLAADGNINYLRVWGGGIYEDDAFYALCDQLGIMVWQDFMFGGSEVPDYEPRFREECRQEATEAIKRLRNHPCIVMWCGSNETDAFYLENTPLKRPGKRYGGWQLFHHDFPQLLVQLCPEALYIPSCPCPGLTHGMPNTRGVGTYHGNFDAHQFAEDAQFDSEATLPAFDNECYGVSADPQSALRRYLSATDLQQWNTPSFRAHHVLDLQRNDEERRFYEYLSYDMLDRANDIAPMQRLKYYDEAHCELIKRYTEVFRRNSARCSGVAYWMYNNAYPMMGWAVVDYYGTPKAAWYAMKRAFAPVLPIIAIYDERIVVYLSNHTACTHRGMITLALMRFDGQCVGKITQEASVAPGQGAPVCQINIGELGNATCTDSFILATWRDDTDGSVVSNHRLRCASRECRLPAANIVVQRLSECRFKLKCSVFASEVILSPWDEKCYPDDNCFDLYPNMEKEITFSSPVDNLQMQCCNAPERGAYVCALERTPISATVPEIWHLTVYNPTNVPCQPQIAVESDHCRARLDGADVLIAPHECAQIKVQLEPEALQHYPQSAHFTVRVGEKAILGACTRFFAQCVSAGKLCLANNSQAPMDYPAVSYRAVKADGTPYETQIPTGTLAPGATQEFTLAPADPIVPWCSEVFSADGSALFQLWDDATPFAQIRQLMTLQDYHQGEAIEVFPFDGECPTLLDKCHGWHFVAGTPEAPYLRQGSNWPCEVLVFLHARAQQLYLDLFVIGPQFQQDAVGEDVWKQCCIELLLGYPDNSVYRDYSLAYTLQGPQIFLRRGNDGFGEPCLRNDGNALEVQYCEKEKITHYHLRLDTAQEGMPELLTADEFRIGMNVRNRNCDGISIFNGIGYMVGCVNATTVKNHLLKV